MKDLYKILIIDLKKREYSVEIVDNDISDFFIGGYGIGLWWLSEHTDVSNPLMIFTSGISDKANPIYKYIIMTKTSKGKIEYGNMGGNFGSFLKSNDYDGLIILNNSNSLVDIFIDGSTIKFENSEQISTRKNSYIYDSLKNKFGQDISTLYITESAMRGDLLARVISDKYRGVSKNLAYTFFNKNIASISIRENNYRLIKNYPSSLINTNSRCEGCITGCRMDRKNKATSVFTDLEKSELNLKKNYQIKKDLDEYGIDLFGLSKSIEFAYENLKDIYHIESLEIDELEKIVDSIISPNRSIIYEDLANGVIHLNEKYKISDPKKTSKESKDTLKVIDSAAICLFSVNSYQLSDVSYAINHLGNKNYNSYQLEELLLEIKKIESKLKND